MYNPYMYAVVSGEYNNKKTKSFSRNSAKFPSQSDYLIPRPASFNNESRFFELKYKNSSQYQPKSSFHMSRDYSHMDNPFLDSKPIRYVEKDNYRYHQTGLTSWEKQKYLSQYGQENSTYNYQRQRPLYVGQQEDYSSRRIILKNRQSEEDKQRKNLRSTPTFSQQMIGLFQKNSNRINYSFQDNQENDQDKYAFKQSYKKVGFNNKKADKYQNPSTSVSISEINNGQKKMQNTEQQEKNIKNEKIKEKNYDQQLTVLKILNEKQQQTNKKQSKKALIGQSQKALYINSAKQRPRIINFKGELFELLQLD